MEFLKKLYLLNIFCTIQNIQFNLLLQSTFSPMLLISMPLILLIQSIAFPMPLILFLALFAIKNITQSMSPNINDRSNSSAFIDAINLWPHLVLNNLNPLILLGFNSLWFYTCLFQFSLLASCLNISKRMTFVEKRFA